MDHYYAKRRKVDAHEKVEATQPQQSDCESEQHHRQGAKEPDSDCGLEQLDTVLDNFLKHTEPEEDSDWYLDQLDLFFKQSEPDDDPRCPPSYPSPQSPPFSPLHPLSPSLQSPFSPPSSQTPSQQCPCSPSKSQQPNLQRLSSPIPLLSPSQQCPSSPPSSPLPNQKWLISPQPPPTQQLPPTPPSSQPLIQQCLYSPPSSVPQSRQCSVISPFSSPPSQQCGPLTSQPPSQQWSFNPPSWTPPSTAMQSGCEAEQQLQQGSPELSSDWISEQLDLFLKYTDPDMFTCKVCNAEYANPVLLHRHIQRQHGFSGPFRCAFCATTFLTKNSLRAHFVRVHLKDECRAKGVNFTLPHLVHADGTLLAKLPPDSPLSSPESTDDEPLDDVNKKFKCILCGAKNTSQNGLYGHVIKKHMYESVFKCEECQEGFPSYMELESHTEKHLRHRQVLNLRGAEGSLTPEPPRALRRSSPENIDEEIINEFLIFKNKNC